MPRCPIKNLICVISLLLMMGGGVAMITRMGETNPIIPPMQMGQNATAKTARVDVVVRMLFSHLPKRVTIEGFGVDAEPDKHELEFTLHLPAATETELPLDINWEQSATADNARYFTQITIRQQGKDDHVIVFSDQHREFADLFTIDTRNK